MKKFLTSLLVLVMLAVAIPTFAANQVRCGLCYGSGKCKYCHGSGKISVYNWGRNEKGKKRRVPPYYRKCLYCHGNGKCSYCLGKGTVTSRY